MVNPIYLLSKVTGRMGFRSDTKSGGALQFKEGKRGCVILMLNAAAKGRLRYLTKKQPLVRAEKLDWVLNVLN